MNTDKIFAEKPAGEYAPQNTLKIRRMKKLDRKAKQTARIFGYTFGIVMFLLIWLGMFLCLKETGPEFSVGMLPGIISSVIGIIGVSINCSVYNRLAEIGKKKYASEIMELAGQIGDGTYFM